MLQNQILLNSMRMYLAAKGIQVGDISGVIQNNPNLKKDLGHSKGLHQFIREFKRDLLQAKISYWEDQKKSYKWSILIKWVWTCTEAFWSTWIQWTERCCRDSSGKNKSPRNWTWCWNSEMCTENISHWGNLTEFSSKWVWWIQGSEIKGMKRNQRRVWSYKIEAESFT